MRAQSGVAGTACDECLRHTWLLARLSGHINRVRSRLDDVLGFDDQKLIVSIAGRSEAAVRAEHAAWGHQQAQRARAAAVDAGVELICHCDEQYPPRLLTLGASAPRVVHVAGGMERFLELCEGDPVAIVGARRCTQYGRDTAEHLAGELALVGVTVISGMAAGIDAAAHEGALARTGDTIAVMPGAANLSYPVSASNLHRRIIDAGVAVSELGPGTTARAWTFRARNRIIVALAAAVIVVQARLDSGSMRTAEMARETRRRLGAVPGHVNISASEGTHLLIREHGASLIRGARDVLDLIGLPTAVGQLQAQAALERHHLTDSQRAILTQIAEGTDTAPALVSRGLDPATVLKDLAQLELSGWVRQRPGGQFLIAG